MAKLKIWYDREGCIGAGVCAAIADKVWVMNDDGKADLVNGKQNADGKWELEMDVDDQHLDLNKQAAEGCPALVIHVYKDGEKIFPQE